jgi:hypothetical protein
MLPSGLHGFSSKQPFLQSPELTRLIWIRNNENSSNPRRSLVLTFIEKSAHLVHLVTIAK